MNTVFKSTVPVLFSICLLISGCSKTDAKKKFSGSWLRSDGVYTLVIGVDPNGSPTAKYFNPKQINVKAAVFKEEADKQYLNVLFEDVNYTGSYYFLSHNAEKDILEGKYFQISAGEFYPVFFNRQSKPD